MIVHTCSYLFIIPCSHLPGELDDKLRWIRLSRPIPRDSVTWWGASNSSRTEILDADVSAPSLWPPATAAATATKSKNSHAADASPGSALAAAAGSDQSAPIPVYPACLGLEPKDFFQIGGGRSKDLISRVVEGLDELPGGWQWCRTRIRDVGFWGLGVLVHGRQGWTVKASSQ